MLWDWGSIESVSKWSTGFFWAGLEFLILLALAEIASHVFASRKDSLAAMREQAAAQSHQQAAEHAEARHAEEVGELRRRAEESEQRMANLQQQQADRTLTLNQKDTLIKAIAPFRGQHVTVACLLGDGEAMRFAVELMQVFAAAGWTASGVNQAVYTGPPPVGIEVTLSAADVASGKLPNGALPLIQAMIAMGMTKMGHQNPQVATGTIEFRVGRKPS
jgi:hypothetical protein